MNEIRKEVLERLRGLGFETEDFAAVDLGIRRAWEYLSDNLNLPELPEALYPVWIDLAAGYFLEERQALGAFGAEPVVRSITEGDISLSYQNGTSTEERRAELIRRLARPEEWRLAAYRRLKW